MNDSILKIEVDFLLLLQEMSKDLELQLFFAFIL